MTSKGVEMGDELGPPRRNGFWEQLDLFERHPGQSNGRSCAARFISAVMITSGLFVMFTYTLLFVSGFNVVSGRPEHKDAAPSSSTSSIPQYFQTSPKLYAGPTATGEAAFLAATNPAPFPSKSYVPNTPLETQVPIYGEKSNIFELQGELSHYFPNPDGFGVDEHSLPMGSNISYLYMLSRHGARYPTSYSGVQNLAAKLKNATNLKASGDLEFLNTWSYKLGAEILVPIGKQELFQSGTLHQYMYGHLYPNNGTKIIARSTTQHRMTESAEYFLAGFFGLAWTQNATLELIIEKPGFNNSLAGYFQCPNSGKPAARQGDVATKRWQQIYLKDATARIASQIEGYEWTVFDSHDAQALCAYETVALGYSEFCGLFTYEEWQGYEYSVDLSFAGNNAFQSPTGRAVGIGWQQELLARLQHHYITGPDGNVNYTLDSTDETFPLYQKLNLDFSHDTNIMGILTALGFTQFSESLPTDKIVPHDLIVSHLEPFAARLDIEIIDAPQPVKPERRSRMNPYSEGKPTQYIHFVLNQRSLPLGRSFPECGDRADGWCELETFLKVQSTKFEESQYEYACFGEYEARPFGALNNGVPPTQSRS